MNWLPKAMAVGAFLTLAVLAGGGSGNVHPADTDYDGVITRSEVLAFEARWHAGEEGLLDALTNASYIEQNGGCYRWDQAAANYIPVSCDAGVSAPVVHFFRAERRTEVVAPAVHFYRQIPENQEVVAPAVHFYRQVESQEVVAPAVHFYRQVELDESVAPVAHFYREVPAP
ncbi:hypothetical protein KQI84_07745 [bacterium]|nr:hypothetical protein [bacterium]